MAGFWFPPSGGLLYHLKAFRYRNSYWQEFRRHLENLLLESLQNLPPSQKENLVLIGGSGGHCLSQAFLKSFRKITHIDIDPWAPFFFRQRHPNLSIEFIQQNIFDSKNQIHTQLLERFSSTNSTWIWCNLLGQIGLHYSENDTTKLLEGVTNEMKGRSWISFHDIYSVKTNPSSSIANLPSHFENWEDASAMISQWKVKKIDLIDHLTNEVFSFKRKEILLWPLTPKQLHFIECGFTCASEESNSH